jgi:hypothetical protein
MLYRKSISETIISLKRKQSSPKNVPNGKIEYVAG